MLLVGFATITSPLTATIYFPLLPLLRAHFHTSAQAINLTITLYVVFQALSPAFFGPLSDTLGRRPVYLFTLALYTLSNLGLALNQNSYAALLILRAFQSLGASAAYAISYGVVADVCVPGERGRIMGPVSMALNLGACVGPVVGGWVAYRSGGFAWVFWTLVVVGAALWFCIGLLLPETLDAVAASQGVPSQEFWEKCWWRRLLKCMNTGSNSGENAESSSLPPPPRKKSFLECCRVTSPLTCLRIIFHLDTFLALWMHGSFYTVDYTLVAAVPAIFKDIYSFNELQTGLAYLPRGAGIIIGSYCNGKLMDLNFKVTAQKVGWTPDPASRNNIDDFPIEKARSRGSFWLLLISTATLVGYGWAVSSHVHVSVPLILQFVQGFWGTCFYTIYNTLLVDLFSESPSTAAATASMLRCAMAATGVAILQPLLEAVGLGWYFTFLGIWSGTCGAAAVFLLRKKGMIWRMRRISRGRDQAA
ncbi:Dityrosine transporter 1 [Lasiodiplodia hormozganensis]|uniref:Dityrosine transporter 1 n=1 Tax=Lasiodiplodia hormozganensis TaxID=869390 RepID=A0AA40CYW3_9PEZI|nr:Dityrosine transporter 1 [Lasiodiplodia hormozganensis]